MAQQCSGIYDRQDPRLGFIRPASVEMKPSREDVFVPAGTALRNMLRNGNLVTGTSKRTDKGIQLESVEAVNGVPLAQWMKVREFENCTPVHPHEQIVLEPGAGEKSMRVVDLIAPIGKGQRALIVAPPRSGKTRILTQMANAITKHHPNIRLVVLLLDERPEEVTDVVRSVKGQVFASSNDQDAKNHTRLAALALDYARRWAEAGEDVVLLLDSLTRLGRSANLMQTGPGRTLSGGVDTRALELPRRIFGAARDLEDSGSVTIVATALVETNSRMDDFIYEDFKGTGNCEIVLRRQLAEERVYPAIDIKLSGTRNEELILGEKVLLQHHKLRRMLYDRTPSDAMQALLRMIANSSSNEELLAGLG